MTSRALYGLCLLVSFCSMSYQGLLAKALTDLADQRELWHAITLGSYLLGVGWGAIAYPTLRRHQRPLAELLRLEYLVIAAALLAVPVCWGLHAYYRSFIADYHAGVGNGWRVLDLVLACYQAVPFVLGVLAGLELRALSLLFACHGLTLSWARFWFCFYSGSLLASLSFALAFYSRLSLLANTLLVTGLNLGLAFWLAAQARHVGQRCVWRGGLVVSGLWLMLCAVHPQAEQLHLQNTYYNRIVLRHSAAGLHFAGPLWRDLSWARLTNLPTIRRMQSPYQVVDLVPRRAHSGDPHELTKHWRLFLNGHFQFDTSNEHSYHEALAHLPLMMTTQLPRRVLVLGGGDGLLVRELLAHAESFASLTLVELDASLTALAQESPLATLNENSLRHPKVHVVHADALQWLRHHAETFDAIYMDFTYPYDSDSLRLYSREFFTLVRRHLAGPEGFAVIDAPLQFGAQPTACVNEALLGSVEAAGWSRFVTYRRGDEGFIVAGERLPPPGQAPRLRPLMVRSRQFTAARFADDTIWQLPVHDGNTSTRSCRSLNSLLLPVAMVFRDLNF